jgi:transcriptional regulator with XRE-family HTH domain
VYRSKAFRAAWENELPFHVAVSVVHLRRYRGYSQAKVAKAMGTSQPKIARIEGGDENVTLATLKRLAMALRGRVALVIEPAESLLPKLPPWWEMQDCGLEAAGNWTLKIVVSREDGPTKQAAAAWTAERDLHLVHGRAQPELNSWGVA